MAATFDSVRVVAMIVSPMRRDRAAMAIPTDELPPLTRIVWSRWASSPTVSEPYAVCSISGTAPTVAQSRSLWKGIT